uniref:Uncharacterized protein n=1 Tax=Candidatus Kentrum sp. LPFa TaxID=2126335 RepID=A0A450W1Z4_9GAMM|nr:MAG: hypothetical protein BECKLPF1236B_GA0070989_101924 [Candidatus Kentron sp. LPFa]
MHQKRRVTALTRLTRPTALSNLQSKTASHPHHLPDNWPRSEPRYAIQAFISATVVSNIRLEKPHSLSYQDSTLTRFPPMTRVWVAS